MRISAITNYTNINKAQTFNGLWGKTSKNIDIDTVLCIPTHHETYYYYPYKDETAAEIDKVVKQYSSAFIDDSDERSKYIIKSCSVCTTLPFSQADFDEYHSSSECKDTPVNKGIHNYLSRVKYRYLNNMLEQQTPAINHVFDDLIKPKMDLEG